MKTTKEKKRGISLIILVITIIVIVVLALAVILTIANNNPIENARKAVFENDIKNMQDELNVYISSKTADSLGKYDVSQLNATTNSLEENGEKVEGKTIKDVINSINDKYLEKIVIRKGKIEYIGEDKKEVEWSSEILYGITGVEIADVNNTDSEGGTLTLNNALSQNLINYRIYGKSEQEGVTPAPDNPVEIQSVGDKVTDENDINYGKYKIPISVSGINALNCKTWIRGTNSNGFYEIEGFLQSLICTDSSVEVENISAWNAIASDYIDVNDIKFISFKMNQDSDIDEYTNYHIQLTYYNESKEKIGNRVIARRRLWQNYSRYTC